jgi:hypothetical protein
MATTNYPQSRILSQLSADEPNERVIAAHVNVVMCDAGSVAPKCGDTVTLVTRPKPYGLTFFLAYFVFNGSQGFIIEREG